MNSGSSFPLGRAVACPLEDGCHALLSSSSIISSSIYTYDIVKNTCCIRSPHLLELGGASEVEMWDLKGFVFILITKKTFLLSCYLFALL